MSTTKRAAPCASPFFQSHGFGEGGIPPGQSWSENEGARRDELGPATAVSPLTHLLVLTEDCWALC